MNNILVDTCFWYALYDERDFNHNKAMELVELLELGNILLPYPTLYETINSRFTKKIGSIEDFEKIIRKKSTKIIDDDLYKMNALALTFESSLILKRPLSLVDMVIRLMLDDINLKIDYLISFNTGDFIDLCLKNGIELIDQ